MVHGCSSFLEIFFVLPIVSKKTKEFKVFDKKAPNTKPAPIFFVGVEVFETKEFTFCK